MRGSPDLGCLQQPPGGAGQLRRRQGVRSLRRRPPGRRGSRQRGRARQGRRAVRLVLHLPGGARGGRHPHPAADRRAVHHDGRRRSEGCRGGGRRQRQRRRRVDARRGGAADRQSRPASTCRTPRTRSTASSAPRPRTRTAPTSRSTRTAASTWSGPGATASGTRRAPTSFTGSATAIEEWTPPLAHAGPLGRPSVTVDDGGQPWVAYAIDSPGGQDIRVATTDGTKWTAETAATIDGCLGCRDSGPAPIAVNADGPLVIYVDGVGRAVMAARQTGDTWTTEAVQTGVSASGLSVAVDANGVPWVTYYTGDGAVNLATTSGAGWTTAKIARRQARERDRQPGRDHRRSRSTTRAPSTRRGSTVAIRRVHLASSADGTTFEPIDTNGTLGGAYPSLAVTPDGKRVFLAWYDVATQNILLGVLGDVTDVLVANPSPTPEAAPPTSAPPAAECPKNGIELVAPAGAAVDRLRRDHADRAGGHGLHDLLRQPGRGRPAQRRRLRRSREGPPSPPEASSPGRLQSCWTCRVSRRGRTSTSATSTRRR